MSLPPFEHKREVEGVLLGLIRNDYNGNWNGYCVFKTRPTIEQGYNGILRYVPVHGWITLAHSGKDGSMIYGFDTAHSGDDNEPNYKDVEWMFREAERMAIAIQIATKYEERYLLARDNDGKLIVLQEFHKDLEEKFEIEFNLSDNFGAMIAIIFGGDL